MELKPQNLLVLLKVLAPPQRWTCAALGEALAMSAPEAHASVKRAVACGLAVAPARAEWSPIRPSLLEFVLHGVRYIWPAMPGPVKRGVPTAFGAEPLASELTAAPGDAPVWAHPAGSVKGPTFSPLVFVGGAVAGLLVTDPLADPVRATRDVDAVVNASRAMFHRIEAQVAARGFARDVSSDVICHWVHKASGLLFDLKPVQPEVLCFSNRWYPHAMPAAVAFVATKLEGFASRAEVTS